MMKNTSRLLSFLALLSLLMGACNQAAPTATPSEPIAAAPTDAPAAPTARPTAAPTARPTATPTEEPPTKTAPDVALDIPHFEPGECRFRRPAWPEVVCGDLVVSENRARPGKPTIRLHVAILKSSAETPEPEPLVFLSGGPGSFALEWLQWEIGEYQEILAWRDVIFFDQRGTGYSQPSLDCPEVSQAQQRLFESGLPVAQWAQERVEAHLACLARLRADGIDLSAYNSAASAADVNDLRQALGIPRLNLLGLSYGTRLALTVMRDHPEAVRAVILDSPVPPQINLLANQGPSSQAALDLVFERCAADPACAAAYPELEAALAAVVDRLDQQPLELYVSHLISRQMSPAVVNGDMFMAGLFFSLYDPEEILRLPQVIYETYEESPRYRTLLAELMQVPQIQNEFNSEGNRYGVLCREEVPFQSQEEALAGYAAMQPRLRAFLAQDAGVEFAICDAAGIDLAPAVENAAVISDIPILVLTGEFDPVTPPALGEVVVETLANGVHVTFPYSSHGVFSERGCARQIAAAFLDDPAAGLDLSCIDFLRRQPPAFVIP